MFEIIIETKADRVLRALDRDVRSQIAEDIYGLGTRFMDGKRLTGKLKGYRSLRSGDYRIIYDVQLEKCIVRILRIAHWKDVYRDLER
jgi:mRNA interferase RelE/StbE